MSEKTLAKVDYLKPLEDKPYAEVVSEKENHHQEVRDKLASIVGQEHVTDESEVLARYAQDQL